MQEIDLTTLGFLSSTTTSFLKKDPQLTKLLSENHPFYSVQKAIELKSDFAPHKRKILFDTLKNQYQSAKLIASEKVQKNIDLLLYENTFTITTGQQLHLFLGPGFMVYKLISTILAAENYKAQFPDKNFVPIYWLASEDHDFDEIKNTPLFGQNYTWETSQTGACGRFHLKDLPPVFEQLKIRLAKDVKGLQLIQEFEDIYTTSTNLSEATIRLINHLFGQYGLLCFDADNSAFKQLFKATILEEITSRKSEHVFNTFSENLAKSQFSLQLKSRSINLFYLKANMRSRIDWDGSIYKIVGSDFQFTESEMRTEIEQHPEHFSPNAVLRPLYQECILPNIAYIGGNAEINYWIQLKSVFDLYNIPAPALVLRQSAWILKTKQNEWLNSKGIQIEQLFKVKTEQDKLNILTPTEATNPFQNLLIEFNQLKENMQQLANKENLPNIKLLIENGKAYEKSIKELLKAKNELDISKNEKEISKLEQIRNDGFSQNNIQERTQYAIEFFIKDENYLNNCFTQLHFKPGFGFFLNN